MYILCNLYVSREGALLAKTKSALSLLIYWNAECCGALWTSMNTSNFLWQSALSMIAPWWFIKGIVNWSGPARFVVLGLIDGPGQLFQYFFFFISTWNKKQSLRFPFRKYFFGKKYMRKPGNFEPICQRPSRDHWVGPSMYYRLI